ncbi:unknown [Coraliomargarita sp. CAG:312]|nr:unknown [Coraliomargarita sp. CAG:312]
MGERAHNLYALYSQCVYALGNGFSNKLSVFDYNFARIRRIGNIVAGAAADNAVEERHNFVIAVVDGFFPDSVAVAVVLFSYYHVHCDVAELAGHVSGVGSFKGCVRQTFARSVRGDKVFVHAQTFAERRKNRAFDNFAVGLCHQTAGSAELTNLRLISAGSGIHQHVNGIYVLAAKSLLGNAREIFKSFFGYFIGSDVPNIDNLVGTLALCNGTFVVFVFDSLNFRAGLGYDSLLFCGNIHVANTD